ncbi:SART-1-domain-containing protein [Clavulina sp. PMI_390]|nr:SART-1-domain-containing protein [Clavulina sp. PMI_390]
MESSLSLEETNKIRISLGLKPLVDDGAPADVTEKTAEDNFADVREKERAAKRTSELKAKLDKKKNQRELNRRLVGTTLGDEDGGDDARNWVKRSKKKEKELAKKRQQDLDNMDQMHLAEYSEKDLAGLKVSHDLSVLEDGENRILTLKDSRILDNEEDELQNVDMAEVERDKRRNELKKARKDYTGFDDDEFGPNAVAGVRRGVLMKYDEDIDGPTESNFRLGAPAPKSAAALAEEVRAAEMVNKTLLTIDYAKNQESSDYLQEGDVGFKKPKTKKKRSTRKHEPELVDASSAPAAPSSSMDVDEKPVIPNMDSNFVDDDDLQSVLAMARRRKLKKPKVATADEIAAKIAQDRQAEAEAEASAPAVSSEAKPGVLEFDDTSEFVRSITYDPTAAVKKEPIVVTINTKPTADDDSDDEMQDGDQALREMDAGVRVKEEEEDSDLEMGEEATEAMLSAIEDAIKQSEAANGGDVKPKIGTSSQQTVGRGMAAALNILRQQGLLQGASAEVRDREQTQKDKDTWLADYRHRQAQRELDRLRSKGGQSKDQVQREWENKQREQAEARDTMELFANYRPDVEIKYHDEDGRVLTTKEAWKALSHKFHGKGSGRAKLEKRLKKIEEERKREAMGSGDTPLSMQAAFQIRQERAGQAHMILSVGNRGAVPQATEFLDAPITKKDKGKNKKKDVTKKEAVSDITGFTANSLPILGADTIIPSRPSPYPSGASGAVISGEPTAASSPAPMRSGFTRIGSTTAGDASAPGSGSGTPVLAEERSKIQIGFAPMSAAKRKAVDQPLGSPPPKRR